MWCGRSLTWIDLAFGPAVTVICSVLAFILSVQCVHGCVCEVACEVLKH